MPQVLGAIGLSAVSSATTGFFATIGGRLLASVAIGALQYGIARAQAKSAQSSGGIATDQTLTGGTNPVFFQMGTYATAGVMNGPELTHGDDRYLTYVIVVSALPGVQLSRLMINGAYATVSNSSPHADYGKRILGLYEATDEEVTGVDANGTPVTSDVINNYAWIKWYDGSQTVADPMMLAKYGSHPTWPWSADMIGRDTTYAILTFKGKAAIYPSKPTVRFEVTGIPLYDISKDTTAGGSGPHRWGTPSTWQPSDNPMVQAYNVLRGVTIQPGMVYGGPFGASDLPADLWIDAVNKCNVVNGGVPTFRCGIEVNVFDEPASVLEEIAKSCSADFADVGGALEVQVGEPPLPEYFFTDDDVIVTADQSTTLFNGDLTGSVFNAASAVYPEPGIGWERKDSPTVSFPDFQAADLGKPLIATMEFATVPYPDQVQRLSSIYVKDSRKTRRHVHALPPSAAFLSPMRTVSWASVENGYGAGKLFRIAEIQDDILSMVQAVTLVETDPLDYDFPIGSVVPTVPPSINPQPPVPLSVSAFGAAPFVLTDNNAAQRRSTIRMTWSTANVSDNVTSTQWQGRLNGSTLVTIKGSTTDSTSGFAIESAVAPAVTYQVRARHKSKSSVGPWSAWVTVTTTDVKVSVSEIDPVVITSIATAQATADSAQADADEVMVNHNALVAGFTGTLVDAFDTVTQIAKAEGKGWLVDPYFADWSATTTLDVNNWGEGGNPTFQTRLTDGYGGGVYTNIPAGSAAFSHFVAYTDANNGLNGVNFTASHVTVTLEFDLIAGNLDAQQLYVQWSTDGTTWVTGLRNGLNTTVTFTARGVQVIPGVRQIIQEVWEKPAGTFTWMRLVYLTKANASAAVLTQIKTYLLNIRASTKAEIDAYKTYTVATATNGATTTVQGIGAALAQVNTALQAQVGATNANLTNNYITTATSTAALTASENIQKASISKGDAAFPRFNDSSKTNWNSGPSAVANTMYGSGSNYTFSVPSAGTQTGFYKTSGDADWKGAKNAKAYTVEIDGTLNSGALGGACVLVDWVSTIGTTFRVSMRLVDMIGFTPVTGVPFRASGTFKKPSNFTGTFSHQVVYVLIGSGIMEPNQIKNLTTHSLAVYAGSATDLLASDLNAEVTAILGTNVSALTGTALATLLTQLAVDAGGTSATLINQGVAVSDLQGNASASLVFGVQAGSAGAVVELVAADDVAGGPVSNVKIASQNVDIQAESLRISNGGNLWPDFNMTSKNFYAGDAFALVVTANQNLGTQSLSIAADAAQKITTSSLFDVDPSTQFSVSGLAWLSGGTGTMGVDLQLYDATDVLIRTISNVVTTTDLAIGAVSRMYADVTTAANECKARFRFRRTAGGTGAGRAGGLRVEKKIGASLLVQGSAIITGTAQMGAAVVDTLSIAGNAVTATIFGQAGNVEFNSTVTWTELARVTITRKAGYSTSLTVSVRYGLEDQGAISMEMRDGARTIWSANQSSAWDGHMDTFTSVFFDHDKAAAVTTYKLFARKTGTDGGGCDVYRTHIAAQQFVR